jgi:hypothetical protein
VRARRVDRNEGGGAAWTDGNSVETMNKEQSIQEAGRVWHSTVAEIPALKRRIRAEAEAEIKREVKERREAAAIAIHYARDRGATKVSLRHVTTRDHNSFEEYVALGNELARDAGD